MCTQLDLATDDDFGDDTLRVPDSSSPDAFTECFEKGTTAYFEWLAATGTR